MNADLQKIRDSRLFKRLPDRAFDRLTKYIKVRAYGGGESILDLGSSGELEKSFGYVVSGRVVFLGANARPLGLALKDEFFLGRLFEIENQVVSKLISAQENTLVCFIPREIIEILAGASESFSQLIEEIYESIFERAHLIVQDSHSKEHFESWLKAADANKTLSSWLGAIEKKRAAILQKQAKERKERAWVWRLWAVGAMVVGVAVFESVSRYLGWKLSLWTLLTDRDIGVFDKRSTFNIWLGIGGYGLILLTNLHTLAKWLIRKWHWKINFKLSGQFHIWFGLTGACLVLLHTAGHLKGQNIAHYGIYIMCVVLISGLVGQLISNRIPKTLGGEKLKLANILKDQEKLKKKAELLMDAQQYKTSILLMEKRLPQSFWANLFNAPLIWFRSRKIKSALQNLGLGKDSAALAAHYVAKEFELRQKIRSLEIANIFFKRWMWLHIPVGYLLMVAGAIHVFLVYYQGLLSGIL